MSQKSKEFWSPRKRSQKQLYRGRAHSHSVRSAAALGSQAHCIGLLAKGRRCARSPRGTVVLDLYCRIQKLPSVKTSPPHFQRMRTQKNNVYFL